MPPLSTYIVDMIAINVISEWICELDPSTPCNPIEIPEYVVPDSSELVKVNSPLSRKQRGIFISHNPFSEVVTITFENTFSNKSLLVYNTQGKLVKHFEDLLGTVIWNTENQNTGIYYIKIRFANEQIIKKVVLK